MTKAPKSLSWQHLCSSVAVILALAGCSESAAMAVPDGGSAMEPDASGRPLGPSCPDDQFTFGRTWGSLDVPRPPEGETFTYTYEGEAEEGLSFENSDPDEFDQFYLPSPSTLGMVEGREYEMQNASRGVIIHDEERYVGFIGSVGVSDLNEEFTFELGQGLRATLEPRCSQGGVGSVCGGMQIRFFELVIEGVGTFSRGEHSIEHEGRSYVLDIRELWDWRVPATDPPCHPDSGHGLRFVLRPE